MSSKNDLNEVDLALDDLEDGTATAYIMDRVAFAGVKEHGMPYFPSLLPANSPARSKPAVGHSEILYQLYALGNIPRVNVLSASVLTHLGLCFAHSHVGTADDIHETSYIFALKAARNCVTKLKQLLGTEGCEAVHEFPMSGKTLAAAMDYALLNSTKCFGTHELFFNGLIALLYGAMGSTFYDVALQGRTFWKYRFPRLPDREQAERDERLAFELQLDCTDECTFVSFLSDNGMPKLPSLLNNEVIAHSLEVHNDGTTSPLKRSPPIANAVAQAKKKRAKSTPSSHSKMFEHAL